MSSEPYRILAPLHSFMKHNGENCRGNSGIKDQNNNAKQTLLKLGRRLQRTKEEGLDTVKKLGNQGLEVSTLGLGCMGMSEFYGNVEGDEVESIQVIHRAIELGMNHLDTADMYGVGRNEELVGKAIQDRRGKVFLATKFGNMRTPEGGFAGVNGKPEYVRAQCEASLKRLGVEVIDLYYQHRVDPTTPIEETIGEMAELVKAGKVRYLGMSEASPETLRRAVKIHPIAALQSEYSLWSRDPEDEILSTCRELGIGFVAYSPLGRGFLTGQIKSYDDLAADDYRRNSPRFQGENFQKNRELVSKIEELAKEKGCRPSQLALAWVLAQGEDVTAIPGTKRLKYLEENEGALRVSLSQQELEQIDSLAPKGSASGDRYPALSMKYVNG